MQRERVVWLLLLISSFAISITPTPASSDSAALALDLCDYAQVLCAAAVSPPAELCRIIDSNCSLLPRAPPKGQQQPRHDQHHARFPSPATVPRRLTKHTYRSHPHKDPHQHQQGHAHSKPAQRRPVPGELLANESLPSYSCATETDQAPLFQWDSDPVASARRWKSLDRIPADQILFTFLPTPPARSPSPRSMHSTPHAVSYTGQLRSATWCLASQAKVTLSQRWLMLLRFVGCKPRSH